MKNFNGTVGHILFPSPKMNFFLLPVPYSHSFKKHMLSILWPESMYQVVQYEHGINRNTSYTIHTKTLHFPNSSLLT